MVQVSLVPIRDSIADGRSLLTCDTATTEPYFVSTGDIDLTCPHCGFVVCSRLESVAQVRNLAFACQHCGRRSRTRH